MQPLVAKPTTNWDYPERVALLRNLIASRRVKEAAALCKESLAPAVFRYAWLPLSRRCLARRGAL